MAISRASRARSARRLFETRQPTMARLKASVIGGPSPGIAVRDGGPLELAAAHSNQPQAAHQPADTVAADVDAFTLQLGPDLVDAIDVKVLLMCQPSRNSLALASRNSLARPAVHVLLDGASFLLSRSEQAV